RGSSIERVSTRSVIEGECRGMNAGCDSPAAEGEDARPSFASPATANPGRSSAAQRAQSRDSPAPPPSAEIGTPQRTHRDVGSIGWVPSRPDSPDTAIDYSAGLFRSDEGTRDDGPPKVRGTGRGPLGPNSGPPPRGGPRGCDRAGPAARWLGRRPRPSASAGPR